MRLSEKSGFLIRTMTGVLACTCCVSLAWSHGTNDSHRDRLEQVIEPDDVYELCLVLTPQQPLRYAFNATQELAFNVHYHADHEVFYPVPEHPTANAEATFTAESEQEYCLMWTNPAAEQAMLSLEYEKGHR